MLLFLTGVVAFALVGFSLLLSSWIPSAEESKRKKGSLAEYGRAWCVHQFVPFADKLIGLSGAMDNRMLSPSGFSLDWSVRFPLIILCFIWPNPPLLLVGHIVNIVSWSLWMPAVWDHMCWASLLELTLVGAILLGGGRDAIIDRFLRVVQPQLIMLYFSAAFWKLTTSWYDAHTSCAPVLLSELLAGFFSESVLPGGSWVANLLLHIAPVFVAALEFAVPIAFWVCPPAGVLLALLFHQTINLMPMTYAGGFSLAMCSRLVYFTPGSLAAAFDSSSFVIPSAIVALVGAIMVSVHRHIDSAGVAFLVLAFLYLRGLGKADLKPIQVASARTTIFLGLIIHAITFFYAFGTPILGLQAMASSTMYGNLKQFGGSNHLLVPTGLLQAQYSDGVPKIDVGSWAVDAFGGGLVRVDSTNSSILQQLAPADATAQLPKHARDMLKGIGASGAYFELYAARNYFGRHGDLQATALHNRGTEGPRLGDPPYAQPAYELRRVLALARAHGEDFEVVYTRLPWTGTPADYRDFRGTSVVLQEFPREGKRICTVNDEPCNKDEIALLPSPPKWLTWIFHPYPMPLLPGDTTEVHCST